MSTHTYTITDDGRHGYPYRAQCVCGWQSNTYAAEHAAQAMADDHIRRASTLGPHGYGGPFEGASPYGKA